MFGLFVASIAVGALATGIGGMMSSAAARKQARAQARYQRAQNEARRQTTLGTMERDLTDSMSQTYEQAGDISGQIDSQSIGAMSNTYLGQIAAESELTNMKQQNAQAVGDVNLQMGTSGAEQDVTLQTVINSQIQQQEGEKRSSIDASRGMAVYQMDTNVAQANQQQDRMLGAYKPGDAIMRRYEYTRGRVNAEAQITDTYMGDVIKANKDYTFKSLMDGDANAWSWFGGDVLGFVAGAAGAGQQYAMWGGTGGTGGKAKKPVGWGATSSNNFGN